MFLDLEYILNSDNRVRFLARTILCWIFEHHALDCLLCDTGEVRVDVSAAGLRCQIGRASLEWGDTHRLKVKFLLGFLLTEWPSTLSFGHREHVVKGKFVTVYGWQVDLLAEGVHVVYWVQLGNLESRYRVLPRCLMSLFVARDSCEVGFKVVAPGGTLFVMKFLFRLIYIFLLALDLIEAFLAANFAQVESE